MTELVLDLNALQIETRKQHETVFLGMLESLRNLKIFSTRPSFYDNWATEDTLFALANHLSLESATIPHLERDNLDSLIRPLFHLALSDVCTTFLPTPANQRCRLWPVTKSFSSIP